MKKLAYLAAGLLFVSATAAQAAKPEFFHIELDATITSGQTLGISDPFEVPAGKRLFIDQVSCTGSIPGGAQVSTLILRTSLVGDPSVFVLVAIANRLLVSNQMNAHEETSTFVDDNVTTSNFLDLAVRRTSSVGQGRVVCSVSGRSEDL